MAFVCFMFLASHLPPLAVVREESIGLGRHVVYLRQAQSVGLVQQSLIEAGSTYYIYILIRPAAL